MQVGIYLAFSIRNVKIKGLNDSKQNSAILYITTTITFIAIISNFLFGDYINVDGAVYSLGVSTASTFVLGFIFIPKVLTSILVYIALSYIHDIKPVNYTCINLTAISTFERGYIITLNFTKL